MKKSILFGVFLHVCLLLQAQLGNDPYTPPAIVPQAPEVSSLLKFTETPVSYQTGVPNISIPIANISGRDLSASVSISYHAGGHRVNEESTWVGLGWSLSAGGQITRTVKGAVDDHAPMGYVHTPLTIETLQDVCENGGTFQGQSCVQLENNESYDFDPDDFNYSMMGLSGRFMFDQRRDGNNPQGHIVQFPEKNMIIEPTFAPVTVVNGVTDARERIIAWDITDTNGTKYRFEEGNRMIKTNNFTFAQGGNTPQLNSSGPAATNLDYIETWDLVRAVSVNNDTITFEYNRPTLPVGNTGTNWVFNDYTCTPVNEQVSSDVSNPAIFQYNPSNSIVTYAGVERSYTELTKITTSQGYIEFVKSTSPRQDTQSNKYSLKTINLYSTVNGITNLIKSAELIQDYFVATPSTSNEFIGSYGQSTSIPANQSSFLNKRLKLNEVKFHSTDVSTTLNDSYSYNFIYNNQELPHKRSNAQDHWGYYNGAGNVSLIPGFSMNVQTGYQSSPITINYNPSNSANRNVNPNYTQASVLKEIIFPEGGKTVFTFESNQSNAQDPYDGYATQGFNMVAYESTPNEITTSGNTTDYRFYKSFSISNDAKDAPGDSSKTEVNYNGYTSRCADSDAIYGLQDMICNTMFLKIFEENSSIPIVSEPIWSMGSVLLDKGKTYRAEITMQITASNNGSSIVYDYDFDAHSTSLDIDWKKQQTFYPPPAYFGGLRVKEIKTINESSIAKYKQYQYEGGSILSAPVYYSIGTNAVHSVQSSSWQPLITSQGSYVNYLNVVETMIDSTQTNAAPPPNIGNGNGNYYSPDKITTIRRFARVTGNLNGWNAPYVYEWTAGRLNYLENMHQSKGDKTETLIRQKETFTRSIYSSEHPVKGWRRTSRWALNDPKNPFLLQNLYTVPEVSLYYFLYSFQTQPYRNRTTLFENGKEMTTTTTSYYESIPFHSNPTRLVTTGSDGKVTETLMKYPYESGNSTLLGENRVNTLLETITVKDSIVRQRVKNEYAMDQGNYLPKYVKASKFYEAITGGIISAPEPEERLVYHSYYANGKVREVSKKDGTYITYIWGYNGTMPVAKIENATYGDISSYVSAIESASDLDNDRTEDTIQSNGSITYVGDEGNLRVALNNLRNALPNAMVTSYTYDPLIGVTSITDPRGNTIYYDYDGFNRLISVKDRDGHLLSTNTYNYKN